MQQDSERFVCSAGVPGYEGDELVVDSGVKGHFWLTAHRPRNERTVSVALNAEQARRLAALLLEFAEGVTPTTDMLEVMRDLVRLYRPGKNAEGWAVLERARKITLEAQTKGEPS